MLFVVVDVYSVHIGVVVAVMQLLLCLELDVVMREHDEELVVMLLLDLMMFCSRFVCCCCCVVVVMVVFGVEVQEDGACGVGYRAPLIIRLPNMSMTVPETSPSSSRVHRESRSSG